MEKRSEEFWTLAQELIQNYESKSIENEKNKIEIKIKKEMETLKRILFRNQSIRFTEMTQQRFFEAIRYYFLFYEKHTELKNDILLSLLSDSLAMPFNVFTTKQKKSLLKYYNSILATQTREMDNATDQTEGILYYQCLDIDGDGYLQLLNPQTNEILETVQIHEKSKKKKIQQAIENEQVIQIGIQNEEIVDILIE